MAGGNRFNVNPFPDLRLTHDVRKQLMIVANTLVKAKLKEYKAYVDNHKMVHRARWKKYQIKGHTTAYIERKDAHHRVGQLPTMLLVGPLPGSLDDNMFGLVSPTLEAMRIKSSYINDINDAAVLATIVEPSVEKPFRSMLVKWMEIGMPGASTGLVHNRDYVYVEATDILHLYNGKRVGYHLLHSVTFPATRALPPRVRGHMSLFAVFHEEMPNQTNLYGTGILDPSGDMPRDFGIQGMLHATMASSKYSYCAQMKKLTWLVAQKHAHVRDHGTPEVRPECVSCRIKVKGHKAGMLCRSHKTCTLCLQAVCGSCKIVKRLSFIAVDRELKQRKMKFCARCILLSAQMNTQEAARVHFVYKHATTSSICAYGRSSMGDSSTTSSCEALN